MSKQTEETGLKFSLKHGDSLQNLIVTLPDGGMKQCVLISSCMVTFHWEAINKWPSLFLWELAIDFNHCVFQSADISHQNCF